MKQHWGFSIVKCTKIPYPCHKTKKVSGERLWPPTKSNRTVVFKALLHTHHNHTTMGIPAPPMGRQALMSRHLMLSLLLFISMASFAVVPVSGIPMILLKSQAAKCIMVDAAHETTLLIHYLTPGKLHYVRVQCRACIQVNCLCYDGKHSFDTSLAWSVFIFSQF